MASTHTSGRTVQGGGWSLPTVLTRAVWLLFLTSVGVATWFAVSGDGWRVSNLVDVDGLSVVMWVAVTFFSGIVHSFSRRYLAADRNVERFFVRVFALTLVVMTMTAADHVVLFVLAWGAMGWIMADLIGHTEGWPQARRAGLLARLYFVGGTILVGAGVAILMHLTDAITITGILANVDTLPPLGVFAAGLLVTGAMVQSALYPFHGWLLSSMTAPTPASAMMHAGFVNAGGILLARFAPVFATDPAVMFGIVVVGAISALLAQAWMLVQTDIKARLGCSTVAQMGFMILQAGLGFFAAAVTHLIVHGFYKAYMFLSTGERVEQTAPGKKATAGEDDLPMLGRVAVVAVTAIGAGVLFATVTGKDLSTPTTGLFLTAVIVLSGLHAVRDLVSRSAVPPLLRVLGVPGLMVPAMLLYGAIYNAVSALTYDLPAIHLSLELTPGHWLLLGLFVIGHGALATGWHRKSKILYVTLLNQPQPDPGTVLTEKEDYDDY